MRLRATLHSLGWWKTAATPLVAVAWHLSVVYLPQQESTDIKWTAMGWSCAGVAGVTRVVHPLRCWQLSLPPYLGSVTHVLLLLGRAHAAPGPSWERSLDPLLSYSPVCPLAQLCQSRLGQRLCGDAHGGLVHVLCVLYPPPAAFGLYLFTICYLFH